MNREAIFSDGSKEFVRPWEPKPGDKVVLRVRVGHGEQAEVAMLTRRGSMGCKPHDM